MFSQAFFVQSHQRQERIPTSRLKGMNFLTRWTLLLLLALSLGWSACKEEKELVVFTASSLTEAFQEVGNSFEAEHSNVRVRFNFAGSSILRLQLEQSAGADVFASADLRQMELAQEAGRIQGEPRIFAANTLVLITPRNDERISHPVHLIEPGLKLVLAQAEVPAGAYAREVLKRIAADPAFGADFAERVLANLVSQETNVRQVMGKVILGEADAALVYRTDVTRQTEEQVRVLTIPAAYNVTALYPVALVEGGQNPKLSQAFVDFLLAPHGQAILKNYGFAEPPP